MYMYILIIGLPVVNQNSNKPVTYSAVMKCVELNYNTIQYNTSLFIWQPSAGLKEKQSHINKDTHSKLHYWKLTEYFILPHSLWLLSRLVPPSSASEYSDLMALGLYKSVFNFNFNFRNWD